MAEAAPGEAVEAEIVLLVHRGVSARPLAGLRETNLDIVRPEPLRHSLVDDRADRFHERLDSGTGMGKPEKRVSG
ncbi:MAG: hypothetical protein OXI87_10720 [Albidovulum sp.]|nr:hypothetical protein [Albidovulum sp.]